MIYVFDNFKSNSHMHEALNPRIEYRKIKGYINEYIRDINNINSSLEADPNNKELINMLKDKQYRKALFEDDLKIIRY